MRFVDVTNDVAFRKIFGNENKKKSLISLLNAVINLPGNNRIDDVEITNPYQLSNLSGGKSTIIDVKARDKQGNIFIVEMQVAEYEFFHKRILYYTSQSYTAQIDKGADYQKLSPVYFIGILEFEIGNNPNYFSRHKVLDVETNEQVIQDVEFNFIELPKFTKTIDQLETNIDQWTFFIKNAENLNIIPENVTDEGLQEAYIEADKYSWTQQELEDYLRASIKEGDDAGRIALAEKRAAEKAAEKAKRETRIEERLSMAKILKSKGMDIDFIMDTTGLTSEEVERL